MEVVLNYWAILVSALSVMVIGSLWYSPLLFGKVWMKGMNFKESDLKKGNMGFSMGGSFITALLMCYILAHYVNFFEAQTVEDAVQVAFWPWLGFKLPVIANTLFWEQKPWSVFWVNATYHLVVLVVPSVILALWA